MNQNNNPNKLNKIMKRTNGDLAFVVMMIMVIITLFTSCSGSKSREREQMKATVANDNSYSEGVSVVYDTLGYDSLQVITKHRTTTHLRKFDKK